MLFLLHSKIKAVFYPNMIRVKMCKSPVAECNEAPVSLELKFSFSYFRGLKRNKVSNAVLLEV